MAAQRMFPGLSSFLPLPYIHEATDRAWTVSGLAGSFGSPRNTMIAFTVPYPRAILVRHFTMQEETH